MTKYFIVIFLLFSSITYGNNLQISPVTVSTTGGNSYLNFSISWDNSWRLNSNPFNWDAVWVFVKRRDCAGFQWHHVNLSPIDSSHTTSSTLFVDAYADKKGVMIYRAGNGSGNVNNINIRLKLDSVPVGDFDYQVHGIEMVYVPEGSFYAGDGASYNCFAKAPIDLVTNPYLIINEAPITIGADTNNLSYRPTNTSFSGMFPGILPASYPKGFSAFYCMKYEISQGQYAQFLNSLTQDAFLNRDPSGTVSYRYTIQGLWPQLLSLTPNRACNFLSFQDLAAYLDWAALSPMTELEYEKVCRGSNNAAIANEKAWGSVSALKANIISSGTDGLTTESVTDTIPDGFGIANFSSGTGTFDGPLRCGFAAKVNTNRYKAGATFYGVMEMSGNILERCYNLALPNGGGIFVGSHGDGELTSTPNAGFANVGWPFEGYASYYYYEKNAVAARGGSWYTDITKLSVSDRSTSYTYEGTISQARNIDYGGRGVSRRQ
jgi:formylglycine-generating enzyme required for sulfatase activity